MENNFAEADGHENLMDLIIAFVHRYMFWSGPEHNLGEYIERLTALTVLNHG